MIIKEKTKKHIAISSILLSLLMMFSTLSAIPAANASYDYDILCAANMYTTNWLQYSNNAAATDAAFYDISNLLNQKIIYHPGYMGFMPIYGEVWDWGSSAAPNDIYDRIDHDINVHDLSYVLYVGHGGPNGFYVHTNYPNNEGITPPMVSFSTIKSHTTGDSSHRLAFMWVCNGGTSTTDASPQAWNNPSTSGYTWIGFSGASPWLIEYIKPNQLYKHWLVFFYYFALNGYSVQDALNRASIQADCLSGFSSSPLGSGSYLTYWPYSPTGYYSGQMHVLGNPSGTHLPP